MTLAAAPGQAGLQLATARRNAFVLAAAQAIVGSAGPITMATGGLAGSWLLIGDKSLATLPVTGFTLGVALGAFPAAALMRVVGRRLGLSAGALVVSVGGLFAAGALFASSFLFFALALCLVGVGNAFTQQYRFAAVDNAPQAYQPRAIGIVLAGGMVAAVVGPQTVLLTDDLFLPVHFAGAYLGMAALGLIGAAVIGFLRMHEGPSEAVADEAAPARPLAEIVRQPRFLAALVCGAGSYGLMTFVMTGAPLAIVACGLPQDVGFVGIQWHVLAMFGPSFFTGRIIARVGKVPVIACGLLLLAAAAAIFLSGTAVWNFWLGLVLLGLGWNFGFIGATAMVAETHRPSEKNKTQGLHDLVLFSTVASASLLSGHTLVTAGWDTMNTLVFPVAGLCLLALAVQSFAERRSRAAA
ncbi:MFS transporter [Aurantimonas sp. VKM B-3413]|uniref:MFS transporter n=1 Tax=Aurantimonas sp. VKM B-3413 TaxID=2779401 RepID=UPI001E396CB6|nr:MFS transporter [Aurantimonas sp. VKM B-3413]